MRLNGILSELNLILHLIRPGLVKVTFTNACVVEALLFEEIYNFRFFRLGNQSPRLHMHTNRFPLLG